MSSRPNAERCAAWWVACATARAHQRRRAEHAVEPRVVDHLDDRRGRRGPPRRRAAPARRRARSPPTRSSGCRACPSAAAMRKPLRVPSGSTRGTRKHDSPAGACASTRKASHIGAEQNHLWPVEPYSPSPTRPAARRRSRARRSRPAARSSPSRRARFSPRASARVVAVEVSAAPTRPRGRAAAAAPARRRRSSRAGSRRPPRPARAA